MLKKAGFSLGFKHSEESRANRSLMNKGKKLSDNTKTLMSLARKGINLSDETKVLISQSKKGVSLTEDHKAALKDARKDITLSDTHKNNISITKGCKINVYSSDQNTLINSFSSARKAAKYFNVTKETILKYARDGKLFKDQWILSIESKNV